jgi:hypothetical protein
MIGVAYVKEMVNLVGMTTVSNCSHFFSHCNDNNPCTTDKCDPVTGDCIYTPIPCSTTNKCKTASCPTTGLYAGTCVTSDIPYPTVSDKCVDYGCEPTTGFYQKAKDCNDGNPCTVDTCDSATGCKNTPKNCDDGNVCTTDQCSGGQCTHQSISCTQVKKRVEMYL